MPWIIKIVISNENNSWVLRFYVYRGEFIKSLVWNNNFCSGLWIHLHGLVCLRRAELSAFVDYYFFLLFPFILKHPWKIKCSSKNATALWPYSLKMHAATFISFANTFISSFCTMNILFFRSLSGLRYLGRYVCWCALQMKCLYVTEFLIPAAATVNQNRAKEK